MNALAQLPAILGDIRLGHSIFALPFAMLGLLIGTRGTLPDGLLLLKVVLAMVFARSAAMGWNRLVDARFDATNPRTRGRALPAGRASPRGMAVFTAVCALGFLGVAASLNRACLLVAPAVLVVLLGYSLVKRFSNLSHLALGLALALAPPAAYLASRGSVDADARLVLLLGLAVLCWVSGFDVIYACQDVDHDRREGLHSLPARWGVGRALLLARGLHAGMLLALCVLAAMAGLGAMTWLAIALVATLLCVEHGLVRGGDLSRVNAAFFTLNGVVSLAFAALVGADMLWR